ncbi:biotin transporter BioY [Legionella bozemanae]|uniref:biotin transporter BioY n=1 Tax=Legionella bozemanae TaxID=447 RepID=UPI00399C907E
MKKSVQIGSNLFLIIMGLLFVILMALKRLPIPATSIEMSLQSLSIAILVIFLGKRAAGVILIYLILASFGFPILAEGVANSKWYLAPYAGYYFGFLISSLLLPRLLLLTKPQNYLQVWSRFSFNESSILFCGFLFLSLYFNPKEAWFIGVWPFLLGACLKITVASFIYYLHVRLHKKSQNFVFT